MKKIKGSCDKTSTGWSGVGDISGKYFCYLKSNARRGNGRILEFSITKEFLWKLYLEQDKKCAYTKISIIISPNRDLKLTTASLDRIDSSKGYIEGNVQWVHKDVNKMKMDLNEDDFKYYCKLVNNNYKIVKLDINNYLDKLNSRQIQQLYSDINLWD